MQHHSRRADKLPLHLKYCQFADLVSAMVSQVGVIATLTLLLLAFKGSYCQGRHTPGYLVGAESGFADGSNCTWLEQPRTSTVTALVLMCYCRSEAYRMVYFNCQYLGEPDSCPEWMENKETFYRQSLDVLKANGSPCSEKYSDLTTPGGCVLKKEDILKATESCKMPASSKKVL